MVTATRTMRRTLSIAAAATAVLGCMDFADPCPAGSTVLRSEGRCVAPTKQSDASANPDVRDAGRDAGVSEAGLMDAGTGNTFDGAIDDCAASPCQHGGECVDQGDGFSCDCPDAWRGEICEIDVNECTESAPAICKNGACTNTKGGFSCACPASGYVPNVAGTQCDDINECADARVCGQASGFGACSNRTGTYECICDDARTGMLCEVTHPCALANVCTAAYACVEENAPDLYHCVGQFPEWPVAELVDRFSVSDEVVTDAMSGLTWQQRASESSYSLVDAQSYCAALSLLGTGWRLPTKAELESIVDYGRISPAIDPIAFPGTPAEPFWSSSPSHSKPDSAWFVNFRSGNANAIPPDRIYRVRCVR